MKCNLVKILRAGPESREIKLTVEFVSVRSVFCLVLGANAGPEASQSPSPNFTPCRDGKMMKCNLVKILRAGPESPKIKLTVEFVSVRSVFFLALGANGGPESAGKPEFVSSCAVRRGAMIQVRVS